VLILLGIVLLLLLPSPWSWLGFAVCEILGVGASSDSYNLVAPEPTGRGAAMALTRSFGLVLVVLGCA